MEYTCDKQGQYNLGHIEWFCFFIALPRDEGRFLAGGPQGVVPEGVVPQCVAPGGGRHGHVDIQIYACA